MGLFSKHEWRIDVTHIYGLDNYGKDTSLFLFLYPERISLDKKIDIPITNIIHVETYDKTELVQVSNHPIVKAIVGASLFGGVGAIVGSVVGSGKSTIQSELRYLYIKYFDNDTEKEMLFCAKPIDKYDMNVFAEKLKRKLIK